MNGFSKVIILSCGHSHAGFVRVECVRRMPTGGCCS